MLNHWRQRRFGAGLLALPAKPEHRKRARLAIWGVTILVAAAIAYEIFAPARVAPVLARPAVPVTVVAVARQPIPVRLETIGTVQTIANVSVKSRIDGVITDVLITDGQFVKTGDIMFKLDDRAAKALVDQNRAQLGNARADVARYQPLVGKEFISRQTYDTAVSNEKMLAASVDNFAAQLSYYTIVAPIDGRVGTITIKAGNSIKANDAPLVTINQVAPIYVGFTLPQAELPGIRDAMSKGDVPVNATINGDPGPPVVGKIAFFDNAVDINSGTIAVKAVFANDEQRLWPGQFVNVAVTERVDPNALTIPQAAVLIGQSNTYVYVIKNDNTAEMRPVKVARTIDGQSVISDGLSEGERVATDGQLRLTGGSRVDVRDANKPKPDSAS
ncbi:MAG TPA: efflux RND transporter periplasmic adaptor subunit [Stellaceae bacterium]|jgi:multidrug efflux system membrane fusion protein|nr:efflux RND transporter periplasmic adaptor subunit [Stellaceae bacterium]